MSKRVSSVLAAVILTLTLSALAFAQTTTTTVTQTVQNPDGTYTIIEYPVKKEVTLQLTPVTTPGAQGVATILRDDTGTRIKLNLTNVPADVTALTLYAVDDSGMVTALGPIAISNGTGTLSTTTPLSRFMLIASPEGTLSAYDANTKVFFRSAVPQGFAVIPVKSNPAGEKVSAVAAPTQAGRYTAPLLNIPSFKTGDDTKIKVNFTGPLSKTRATVKVKPRKDGPTEISMKLDDFEDVPAGQKLILWAVGADGTYQRLGQAVSAPGRDEAEIKGDTTLPDFGLLLTMESAEGTSPAGPAVATIQIVP